jgi:DNA invertase Pin-like site-specific DNA recombinase
MQVGYARVSTPDQSLAVQLEALQQSGCTKLFQEVASGAQADRQGLTAALDYVRPDDTLVVWRLDRLGRSLGQLIVLMNTLHDQQVGFQSLVEAIDTTTATGQFFFQITGAFAELERNLMRERTLAGLASARRRGRKGGRRKAIDPKTFEMALQLYEARTSSVQSICTRLGIAQRTFYRDLAAHRTQHKERVEVSIEVVDMKRVKSLLFR